MKCPFRTVETTTSTSTTPDAAPANATPVGKENKLEGKNTSTTKVSIAFEDCYGKECVAYRDSSSGEFLQCVKLPKI